MLTLGEGFRVLRCVAAELERFPAKSDKNEIAA
jgi:hypothetical protein